MNTPNELIPITTAWCRPTKLSHRYFTLKDNSSALQAMESRLSCINPSICDKLVFVIFHQDPTGRTNVIWSRRFQNSWAINYLMGRLKMSKNVWGNFPTFAHQRILMFCYQGVPAATSPHEIPQLFPDFSLSNFCWSLTQQFVNKTRKMSSGLDKLRNTTI